MEPIIFDQSPLAEYLKDEGGEYVQSDWAAAGASSPEGGASSVASESDVPGSDPIASSTSSRPVSWQSSASPRNSFAPTGRPTVRSRFRNSTISNRLWVDIPQLGENGDKGSRSSKRQSLQAFKRKCSAAVASTITSNDNAKFLEQFRYVIVASQLLSSHGLPGQMMSLGNGPMGSIGAAGMGSAPSAAGVAKCLVGVWAATVTINWMVNFHLSWRRLAVLVGIIATGGAVGIIYVRQQWLQRQKDLALGEMADFVSVSHEYDSAVGAALALVQEVELVSRGYRLSTPLPPISRIEDRSQARKCVRLRKALLACYLDVLNAYKVATSAVVRFSDSVNVEKYYDVYEISDFDVKDAVAGHSEQEFEDQESLRTLKILAARFTALRKIFLCALLALDAIGDGKDLLPWTTAAEAIKTLNTTTRAAYERLRSILSEAESFPSPPTPKMPSTPGKEKWRGQFRQLGSLSTGIRGLQAKMHILREESDKALDESLDMAEFGPSLMMQYDSIGADLRDLMSAWEEGKAALAQGIDRNEKRLSTMSMSTAMSPTLSWSGLTTVDEGGAEEAYKALTGEYPPAAEEEAVYEAVALPRPRSMLTREERIAKMKEDREVREQARQSTEATRGMLKELEMVIKPRQSLLGTTRAKPKPRVVSM